MALYIGKSKMKPMVGSAPMRIPVPLPYDAEIEYLQSDGYQYISINSISSARVVLSAQGNKFGSEQYAVSINEGGDGGFIGSSGNGTWCIGDQKIQRTAIPFTDKVVADINFTEGLQEGTIENTSVSASATFRKFTWYLFGNGNTGVKNGFVGKIYSVKFYTNYVNIAIDLIPVRIKETGFLYDRISGLLYGNEGTGSFTLGNDK